MSKQNDYWEIAKELGKTVDTQASRINEQRLLLEEAVFAIEKLLYLVYHTPYTASLQGAGDIVRDAEDTLARIR